MTQLKFPLDFLWRAGRDAEVAEVRTALQQIAGTARSVSAKAPNLDCSQALKHWDQVAGLVRSLARMRVETTP